MSDVQETNVQDFKSLAILIWEIRVEEKLSEQSNCISWK